MGEIKTETTVTSVTTWQNGMRNDVKEKESAYGSPKWRTMASTSRFMNVFRLGL